MIDNSLKDQIDSRIKVFWEHQDKFRSHPLMTEQPNPDTMNLSELAKDDLPKGINSIKDVDVKQILKLQDYAENLDTLKKEIEEVFSNGNRVFISGCGASGRLAVALEYLWNYTYPDRKGQVIGFLGGGDNAMIKSIEGFEDFKDYGIEQLKLAGFQKGDLLIAASASGESPFVLATAEYASENSVSPWFVHCNTNDALKGRIKDHVIYNSDINTLSLYTGQMALTGSTRMQATTILMLGIGLPLFGYNIIDSIRGLADCVKNTDMTVLSDFIKEEAETYKNNEYVLYDAAENYGITVLTDTTERTPTFNLIPFENQLDDNKKASWCYILFDDAENSLLAWNKLLGREPRTLDWAEETSRERLLGFDFSHKLLEARESYGNPYYFYKIKREGNNITFAFKDMKAEFSVKGLKPLFEQLLLKLLMNTSSTLVMGRLGFYEGNLMTSVYPSNSKLIDRSIRYIDFILKNKHNIYVKYEDIAEAMFDVLYKLKTGESIVLKTVDRLVLSVKY